MIHLVREGFLEEVALMDGENLNSCRQAESGNSGRGRNLGKTAGLPPSTGEPEVGPRAQDQAVGNKEEMRGGEHHQGPEHS